ncbi:uncharacterized protein LOC141655206 [Silene latifolia]|uniref:uncharacterized protein LOC141655206 n=1 Tax=Silene latifolia TaxID=37657 RepID=UPI003D7858EF
MVEMEVDQLLPAKIAFKDEKGIVIQVAVEYDWKPVRCTKCNGMGHVKEQLEPVARTSVVQSVQSSAQPAVKEEGHFHTPTKRFVKLTRQERSGEGYSSENFGAHSYKEVLSSPSRKNLLAQGLFGLLETKIKNKAFNKAMNSFNNGWSITTNNGYHSGGKIWVLWQPNIYRVHVIDYNAQHIHMKVGALVSRNVFYLTMAIAADFNCVLAANEIFGGSTSLAKIEPFRKCVADCEVLDIAAVGSVFPDMFAHILPEGMMDHTPCIVKSNKVVQGKRSFKYFNMWDKAKDFLPLVKNHWNPNIDGTPLFKLAKN